MKKKVLILGYDGYIGWSLALHLLKKGYQVAGIDNYTRRQRVRDVGSNSLTPISCRLDRLNILKSYKNYANISKYSLFHIGKFGLDNLFEEFYPDTIIHLAEQPSAPWSMIDSEHAASTQRENVLSTLNLLWTIKEKCPDVHLIKLGTMGEYGTPDCDIPEGEIPKKCLGLSTLDNQTAPCPMAGLPFPKSPGSFYHLSKVHDTHNIIFACKTWGLTSTDIMQGVVYGLTDTEPSLVTRFDYDQYFGTIINRFCAQAIINHPLTVYGSGNQKRGFLPLKDSIQCINLIIDNPPKPGTYQVFNQYESTYSLNNLANIVVRKAKSLNLKPSVTHLDNPRSEDENHYYNPTSKGLRSLGYIPTTNIKHEIHTLLSYLLQYKERVVGSVIMPETKWK